MTKQKKFITCDGNQAAAHISYMFSEVAAIYRKCNLKVVLPVQFTVLFRLVR
jgi:hypothetical protein